jgi:hypothetical protein
MRYLRLVGVIFAAALVMGLLAASPATARPDPEFVFHGSGLPPVEASIKMPLGAPHTLFYYHGIANPVVECEAARGKGELLNVSSIARVRNLELTYEECRVPGYELTCAINSSKLHGSLKIIGAEGELGYYEPSFSEVLLHIKPASSGNLTEMEFSGTSCPLLGTYFLKKGVIGEIPGVYIGASVSAFRETLALNSSSEQLFKQIEDNLTTTVDELKIGTTPVGMKGELELTLVGGDTVTITV